VPLLLVLGVAILVFFLTSGIATIYRIVFIPLAEWGLALVEVGFIWLVFRTTNLCCPMSSAFSKPPKCCRKNEDENDNNRQTQYEDKIENPYEGNEGLPIRIVGIIFSLLLFGGMIAVSIVLQLYALDQPTLLTLVTYFTIGIISPLTIIASGYALNLRNIRKRGRK
jgi:hypothetical protein